MLHDDDDDDNRREPWTNQEVVSIIILSIFVNFQQLVFQTSSKELPILKLVILVNLEHPKCVPRVRQINSSRLSPRAVYSLTWRDHVEFIIYNNSIEFIE